MAPNRFLRAFEGGIRRFYAPVLDWALGRPAWTLAIAAAIVTGGGGGYLYTPIYGWDPAALRFTPVFHCVRVEVDGDTLRLDALDVNGTVFDSMVIQRALPPPRIWPVTVSPVRRPNRRICEGDT